MIKEKLSKYDKATPVSKPNATLPLGGIQSVCVYGGDPKGKIPIDKGLKVGYQKIRVDIKMLD